MCRLPIIIIILISYFVFNNCYSFKLREDKTKCPKVKAIRNLDLEELLGKWYAIQYYASSEEAIAYSCMQADLSISQQQDITMNFSYTFVDDPSREQLIGNITWQIPDLSSPAHWIHAEDIYEGIYNTYVLDSDYKSWSLLLHCAEKSGSTRYLSSIIMSRRPELGPNVIAYLREKLPRYDIDLQFMFEMSQSSNDCDAPVKPYATEDTNTLLEKQLRLKKHQKHPLKHHTHHHSHLPHYMGKK